MKSENLFNLLIDLSWYFSSQSFDDECCNDLSLIEYMAVKKIIELDNPTVVLLGQELNITKSGISKILTKLEKKGYVFKVKSDEDARVCCLSATPHAFDVIKDVNVSYGRYISSALGNLDEFEVDNISQSLMKLRKSLNIKGYKKPV